MINAQDTAILHVALNPLTGPWSVMKQLATAQAATGLVREVALGIITDGTWPKQYELDLPDLHIRCFRKHVPAMFGTASVLWQYFFPPGIEKWVQTLAKETGAAHIVVHIHNAWLSGVFVPVKSLGDYSVQVAVTFHGVNSIFLNQPIRKRLHRWMAGRLLRDKSILISCDQNNTILAHDVFSIPQEIFTIIHNGTAKTAVKACPRLRTGTPITVGHVGTISERKGWRVAMEAVDLLINSGIPARFVLAGMGPESNIAADCARARPGVMEFLGHVSRPAESLMPKLDVLSLMSVHEGLPMTLIEAMSVGLPVIATPVGGIPEAVCDYETGFLIARSPLQLADRIRQLSNDFSMHQKMSDAAHQRFMEHFEIGAVASRHLEAYGILIPDFPGFPRWKNGDD